MGTFGVERSAWRWVRRGVASSGAEPIADTPDIEGAASDSSRGQARTSASSVDRSARAEDDAPTTAQAKLRPTAKSKAHYLACPFQQELQEIRSCRMGLSALSVRRGGGSGGALLPSGAKPMADAQRPGSRKRLLSRVGEDFGELSRAAPSGAEDDAPTTAQAELRPTVKGLEAYAILILSLPWPRS
jgi:hypothetical protein